MDPLTTALNAAKAVRVDPGECRTLRANARLLRPLIGRGFQVWELQEKLARDGKVCHVWRLGVRLGPIASEVSSQRVDLDAALRGFA